MTQAKRGLGKGLGALLGDAPIPTAPVPGPDAGVREIPVDRITPNPFQPRKSFDAEALDDLQRSIAAHGVLVPVIVRARGDGFELIAGERRWRASAALQRTTIPAVVRVADDRASLEVAIVENLQRENLNPLEEADGIARLLDDHALTQEDVALRLGKSRPAIANALRLLTLPDAVKAMLRDGVLSAGHARALLAAPAEQRIRLAQRTAAEGLSVRALERLASPSNLSQNARKASAALNADEEDFAARMRERYGTHVTLVRNGKGGRIELRFADDAELLRIGDLLLNVE